MMTMTTNVHSDTHSYALSADTDYIWAGTFDIWRNDGPLGRYYRTYVVNKDGLLAGVHNPCSPYYLTLDEFAGIAFHLKLLGKWNEFSDMWYDALTAALSSVDVDVARPTQTTQPIQPTDPPTTRKETLRHED